MGLAGFQVVGGVELATTAGGGAVPERVGAGDEDEHQLGEGRDEVLRSRGIGFVGHMGLVGWDRMSSYVRGSVWDTVCDRLCVAIMQLTESTSTDGTGDTHSVCDSDAQPLKPLQCTPPPPNCGRAAKGALVADVRSKKVPLGMNMLACGWVRVCGHAGGC